MISEAKAVEIARKYYKDVYSYCLSGVDFNYDDAADITQEVFLFFQQKLDRLDEGNLRAWLYSVAKRKVYEYYRQNKRFDKIVSYEDNIDSIEDLFLLFDNYFDVDDATIEKCKKVILDTFSADDRALYQKIYVEKKKYKDVAEEFGTTEKVICTRAFRLRQKVKKRAALMFTSVGIFIIKMFF